MYLLSEALLTFCLFHIFIIFVNAGKSPANLTCTALESILQNRVFFPGEPVYNASLSSYAYAQQQIQHPSCIVKPSNTANVSSIINMLRKSPTTKFAIRSGGHGTNRGFSNIDGGITLDLTSINGVKVLEDDATVSIGTGATWGDVYPILDARNRSLTGSRASSIGIGGFLSGGKGGISFYALQHGFGCDSVLNMEVVLSNGDIVNANVTSNPALFRSLKGGQNNFGIVTRWDIATFSEGDFWGGNVVYPNSTTTEQLEAFTHWKHPENFDPSSSVEQSHVYMGSTQTYLVSNSIFYTKPVAFPNNLKNFTDSHPKLYNTLRFSNIADFANEVQSFSTPNQFSIYATTTVRVSSTILTKVHNLWQASVERLPSNANATSSLTLQSIPAPASDPSRPNSLGFDPLSTPQKSLALVLITTFWEDPKFSGHIHNSTGCFIKDVDRVAREEGVAEQFRYMNYASADFQHPLQNNGQLESLREVALTYDPIGMFQHQVIGGWKLYS